MASICKSCRKPVNADLECGLCAEALCRTCAVQLAEDAFSFRPDLPAELKHLRYCGPCYDERVGPEVEKYAETLELAKGVYFFFEGRKHPIPFLKRAREASEVAACADRNETILRLAFLAAAQGFNAVIDAEVDNKKVRDSSGYQTTAWHGTGWGALVDSERLEKRSTS